MKQVIKIGIILIVAAILAFIIKGSLNAISDSSSELLSAQDFENVVKNRADSAFNNTDRDYMSAKRDYEKIMADIVTEEFITLSDGNKNLPVDKAKTCRDYCNNKYAPLFTKYANNYFNNTSWDSGILKSMQTTASSILASMGASSDYSGELKTIENTANGYFLAEGVIARASKCSTIAGIGQLQSEANKYSSYRLPASTKNRLSGVGATAKNAVHNSIVSRCKNARTYNAAQSAIEAAYQYAQKYGWTSALESAKSIAENVSEVNDNPDYSATKKTRTPKNSSKFDYDYEY